MCMDMIEYRKPSGFKRCPQEHQRSKIYLFEGNFIGDYDRRSKVFSCLNAIGDTLWGIAKPVEESAFITVRILMKTETFVGKNWHGLLEASSYYSAGRIVSMEFSQQLEMYQ